MTEENNRNYLLYFVLIVGLVLLATVLAKATNIGELLTNREALQNAIFQNRGIAIPMALLLTVSHVLFAILPGQPAILAIGYSFGVTEGFLINWLGIVAASQCAYFLSKQIGRPLVERFVSESRLAQWDNSSRNHGFPFFLFVFLIPIFPGDALNYLAGLTNIQPMKFFWANLVGRAPQIFLLSLIGAYGATYAWNEHWIELLALLLFFAALVLFARRKYPNPFN